MSDMYTNALALDLDFEDAAFAEGIDFIAPTAIEMRQRGFSIVGQDGEDISVPNGQNDESGRRVVPKGAGPDMDDSLNL